MHAGAAVNAVTKVGTNVMHGNAFEIPPRPQVQRDESSLRLSDRMANDRTMGLRRNQYGGTFGGPMRRTACSSSAAYQGTTFRVNPTDNIAVRADGGDARRATSRRCASPACNSGRADHAAPPPSSTTGSIRRSYSRSR
jgi:hypothetical protein